MTKLRLFKQKLNMMKKISMDQSRLIILDIMTAIDRVCRELNISYYMAGGTLISFSSCLTFA